MVEVFLMDVSKMSKINVKNEVKIKIKTKIIELKIGSIARNFVRKHIEF